MSAYECQAFRRDAITYRKVYAQERALALDLLRKALYDANTAEFKYKQDVLREKIRPSIPKFGEFRKICEKIPEGAKKVWKKTYEDVIASAPENIRAMANFLRTTKKG